MPSNRSGSRPRNEKTNTSFNALCWSRPASRRLPTAYCLLLTDYSLLFLHFIHRFPFPCHPVFLTRYFLDRFLVAVEGFEVGLEPPGFLFGRPDLVDHFLALAFEFDACDDSAVVQEDIGNEDGSDNHEDGTAARFK